MFFWGDGTSELLLLVAISTQPQTLSASSLSTRLDPLHTLPQHNTPVALPRPAPAAPLPSHVLARTFRLARPRPHTTPVFDALARALDRPSSTSQQPIQNGTRFFRVCRRRKQRKLVASRCTWRLVGAPLLPLSCPASRAQALHLCTHCISPSASTHSLPLLHL